MFSRIQSANMSLESTVLSASIRDIINLLKLIVGAELLEMELIQDSSYLIID